jgi:S1-C subfamily serine protease
LADEKGVVHGLWLSFLGERASDGHDNEYHLGLSIDIVRPILKSLQSGKIPQIRGFKTEFSAIQLTQGRNMGLSDEWISQVEKNSKTKRNLFMVSRREPSEVDADLGLKELDIVLEVNGKLVTKIRDLDVSESWGETVQVRVLRDKQELCMDIPSYPLGGVGTDRVVIWAGAVIQSKLLGSRKTISNS